jgi:hypothetical protein
MTDITLTDARLATQTTAWPAETADLPTRVDQLLRDLVFGPGGFAVRPDDNPVFQANYATALLLDGNPEGSGASSAASATAATRRSPGRMRRSVGGRRG